MFRPFRLLCALLTLLLALPAVQAAHCGPVMDHGATPAMTHGEAHRVMAREDHEPAPTAPGKQMAHDCIGCAAPIDTRVYRPVERLALIPGRPAWSPRPAALSGWLGTPETPPPRLAA